MKNGKFDFKLERVNKNKGRTFVMETFKIHNFLPAKDMTNNDMTDISMLFPTERLSMNIFSYNSSTY